MRVRSLVATVLSLTALSCTSSSIGVTAPAAVKCQVSVENSITTNVAAAGATGTLTVATNRECVWSVTSDAAWAQLPAEANGQGSATVPYKIMPNPDAIQRRATLDVNNTQLSVTQDPAPCRFTVSPASAALEASGGSVSVALATLNGCAWTAASDAAWLTIAAPSAGSGNGTIALRAAENPGPERVGTVRVADQRFVVTEAAAVVAPTPT